MAKVTLDVPDPILHGLKGLGMGPLVAPTGTGAAPAQPQQQQENDDAGAETAEPTTDTEGAMDGDSGGGVGTGADSGATMAPAADPFETAIAATNAQVDAGLQAQSDVAKDKGGVGGALFDAAGSAGVGIMAGAYNAYTAFGDLIGAPPPDYEHRAGIINDVISAKAELDRRSGVNSFIGGTAAFVTAMLGLGKFTAPIKGAVEGSKILSFGATVAEGGVAGGLVFDPNGGRLSDIVRSVPLLGPPINDFLGSKPGDTRAEGRLKNALEGAGLDVVVGITFRAALKVYKLTKDLVSGGKGVDEAAIQEQLTIANKELADAVARAKGQKLQTTPNLIDAEANRVEGAAPDLGQAGDGKLPQAPNIIAGAQKDVTIGGTPARVIGPTIKGPKVKGPKVNGPQVEGPQVGVGKEKPQLPQGGNIVSGALGEKGRPRLPAGGNVIKDAQGGAKEAPPPDLPDADLTSAGGSADDASSIGEAIRDRAKATGAKIIRQPGAAEIEKRIADIPKIETNGVGYKVLDNNTFMELGRKYGQDLGHALAVANQRTGEIWVSRKLLGMSAAKQRDVIMHETGHVLEPQFIKRLTGKEGTLKSLPKQIAEEMKAASKAFRPENWDAAGKGTPSAKAHGKYLSHPAELFADSFAMWKLRREQFGELAPNVAKEFDKHFAPWIDHDFSLTAGDVAEVTDRMLAHNSSNASPGAARTSDRLVLPTLPRTSAVDDFVEAAAKDAEAIDKYGSPDAAAAAGHRFAKANLPYQKLLAPGELQHFMAQISTEFKGRLDLMKGGDILKDKRVQGIVDQRVKLFNEDPAQVLGAIQAAGRNAASMVANMESAFAIANKMAVDLDLLVRNNRVGNYAEFGGDANAAERALAPRLALYIEAIGAAQSMRAAAGRTMRRLRGDFQLDDKTLATIRKLDPDSVARIVEMAGGDRKMMVKLATRGWWDRYTRAAGTIYANNILWLWPSHARNSLGNVFMLMTTPGMRAVGSFMLKEGGQDIRTASMREYRYMLSAAGDAWQTAKEAYLRGDSIINPHNSNEYFTAVSGDSNVAAAGAKASNPIGLRPLNTVGDFYHNLFAAVAFTVGQPLRALGTADEFIKQMSYRATVLAKASVEADALELDAKAYQAHLEARLDTSFDAQGVALDKQALYDSQVKTFSQPLLQGTIGQGISTFVSQHPILRFFLPFVKTPINLFRYSTKLTPGLNLLQREYRQMLKGELGPERQADAYGQMAMGGLLLATGVQLSLSGLITGGGPTDPQHLKALKETGWKPYSIKATQADGSHVYIPFNSLDPLGMQLSFIGDLTQVAVQGNVEGTPWTTMLGAGAISLAKNFANRTYLQSINDLIDAISAPDDNMNRVLASLAANAIPMSSLLREVNPDPNMRDARSIQESVMATLPGFSTSVPPMRDVFGDPVLRTNNLVFHDNASDAADAEQQRMLTEYGIGLTPTPSKQRGGIDLRAFVLKSTGSTAFDRYSELIGHPGGDAKSLKQVVGALVTSKEYAHLPEGPGEQRGSKLWALQRVVDKYRDAAYKTLLRENPDLALATGMQQQAQRAAFDQAQAGGSSSTGKTISTQLKSANAAFGIH